ncbi:hypothetical protein [Streptococcus sp. S784/96/1]|uniref:hypothetical protein n=1 Tax=Streptococcus sp. S784/96/1 TaxID=2653499 RepID=UPI0013867609|nr:hypothetical protein [Streptococcus sp. S784/96/1]
MTKREQDPIIIDGIDEAIKDLDNPVSKIWKFVIRIVALMLFIIIGYLLGGMNQKGDKAWSIQRADYASHIKGFKKKEVFDWTVANYRDLKVAEDYADSTSLEAVTKQHGRADNYDTSEDYQGRSIVVAHYSHPEDYRKVDLYFMAIEGTYRLYQKSYTNLKDDTYPIATAENFSFKWTKEEVDNLSLSQTPKEILAQYGPVTDIFQTEFNEFHQLTLFYQEDNDPTSTINSVSLTFTNMDDKGLRLVTKDGVFRD